MVREKSVNRHTKESQIQRSFWTHCGTERQLGGAAAGPARSSRRKSTLLAVPSLLDKKELHDEKEFLQQMRAGPLDCRFPLFVGLRCMLFNSQTQSRIANPSGPTGASTGYMASQARPIVPIRPSVTTIAGRGKQCDRAFVGAMRSRHNCTEGIQEKAYPFCSASSVFPRNVVTRQVMTTRY